MEPRLIVIISFIFIKTIYAELGAYTSFVNLEKLYTLEDELITVSDVLLKHEKNMHGEDSDVHGIFNISR